jgi:hypothetical protein
MWRCVKNNKGLHFLILVSLIFYFKAELFSYVGKVTYIYGDVEISKGDKGPWEKCTYGRVISSADRIRTGPSGKLIIKFDDGSQIRVFRKTEFLVKEIKPDTRNFVLDIGKVRLLVKKLKPQEKFSIRTPTAVCAVRGTDFSVEVDENKATTVKMFEGALSVVHNDFIDKEILLNTNEVIHLLPQMLPEEPKELPPEERLLEQETKLQEKKFTTSTEVSMDMTKEQVQAAAAEEIKLAEFQQGKALVDAFGNRVRIEEYIVRPKEEQFKMVVLNERQNRFDYFIWKCTFNKKLPSDLSAAMKWVGWRSGTSKPEYYLTATESAASNTVDKAEWGYTDGHVVNATNGYELLFDRYYFKLNNLEKIIYEPKPGSTSASSKSDLVFYVNGDRKEPITYDDFWKTDGWCEKNVESTERGYAFRDGSYKEEYFIIDNDGKEATQEEVNRMYDIFTGKFIKDELLKWNFEIVLSSPEFKGPEKKINLVVEPKIYIDAGIIQAE